MGCKRKIGRIVKILDNLLQRNLMNNLRKLDVDEVTAMHGWILSYLKENKEQEIYQKDVEARFSIGRSTTTNILQCMEKKGYIQRVPVERDARLKKLVITPKGETCHRAIHATIDEMDSKTLKGISEEDLDTFFRVAEQIKTNVEEQL
ncbi:MAG: MarR family winged helix-turn-helix transcriptional regulator [Lachnospiraceae bacterium]|nr:MarR family winged helix-turn-helix transcriptional regulator [Lachnospiraceae bacterium]